MNYTAGKQRIDSHLVEELKDGGIRPRRPWHRLGGLDRGLAHAGSGLARRGRRFAAVGMLEQEAQTRGLRFRTRTEDMTGWYSSRRDWSGLSATDIE
jgi:hypothetical protein